MAKNALVLDDHFGDDGAVAAGDILTDVTSKRFDELEKRGLVREATAAEVKAGSQRSIERDETPPDDKDAKAPENKKAAEPANKGA